MLSVKQGGIKYHFWVFGMTWPGIEPRSPGPFANILLIRPIDFTTPDTFDEITKVMNHTEPSDVVLI